MIVETKFLFSPVHSLTECAGWACGIYRSRETLPMKELMERGRIRSSRRKRGAIPRPSLTEIEQSFRFHENLGTALETDDVLLDNALLDEESYASPTLQVSEETVNRALMKFLNLSDGDSDGALEYMAEFGAFGHIELTGHRLDHPDVPQEVQRFVEACIRPGRNQLRQIPFAFPLDAFWRVRNNVLSLWNLGTAISKKDVDTVKCECQGRRPSSVFQATPDWLAIGKRILGTDLSFSMNLGTGPERQQRRHQRRIVLGQDEERFVALTVCATVEEALYVELLKLILSETEYKECKNCDKYFLVTVAGKEFCSLKCQNAAKVRNWRARQKSEQASGKATTRHSVGVRKPDRTLKRR
jgi:hypothetical protein